MKNYHSVTDFQTLKDQYEKYITNPDSLAMIEKAYTFAAEKHSKQRRKNNDPYLYHLLSVADILIKWRVGPKTICCALLHDVIEDQPVTYDHLKVLFSKEIADVVYSLTKMDEFRSKNASSLSYENLRRLLLSMAKDIRVVIIKLADRLHNMRTLQYLPPVRRKSIATETIYVFAPIAHRLNMTAMSQELFDLSFMYMLPKEYEEVKKEYDADAKLKSERLLDFENELQKCLKDKIAILKLKSRNKGIYSIYKKLTNLADSSQTEIFDLQAVRLIVPTKESCYVALGHIHAYFRPILGRFKDFIAVPKHNLYQSLHTTVVFKDHMFEIQIRTQKMDDIAENGVAAHYRYKEGITSSVVATKEIDDRLKLFTDLLDLENLDKETKDAKKFVNVLKDDLFDYNIYVVTPKGDTLTLPYGSTVLDFAFKIHTDVGLHTQGALVNGVYCSSDTELKSGDIVSVKTNPQIIPNNSWINRVQTHLAKQKIKSFLKKHFAVNRSEQIDQGKKKFEEFLERNPLFATYIKENEKLFLALLNKKSIKSWENLYLQFAKPKFNFIRLLKPWQHLNLLSEPQQQQYKKVVTTKLASDKELITISHLRNIKYELAKCCSPTSENEIVGYVSKNGIVKIHRHNCHFINSIKSHDATYIKDRLVDATWNKNISKVSGRYQVQLRISANVRPVLLNDVLLIFNKLNVTVNKVNATVIDKNKGRMVILADVALVSADKLHTVITNINRIPAVTSVKLIK